jgi:DNA-binding NarL/FixJ family response regulator
MMANRTGGLISMIVTTLCVFSQATVYVHLIVNQSNNGESVSELHRHKPKRHNAKLCPFAIRERIVNALANGDSIRAIVRALRVSNNTVTAIRDQDWQQVAARKERLAAQWEQVATKAVDQLNVIYMRFTI